MHDKTGWMLDDIEVESKDKWIMTPLKGIEESSLSGLLSGQVLNIDNEEWSINKENLLNIKIEGQQTNLEQKTDRVTVSLTLDDKLERAEGKLEVLFTFDKAWKYDSVISKGDFTISMKEEYVINISENDLMTKVIESELPVGETKQTISVGEQEISDFKIEEQKSESKGSYELSGTWDQKSLELWLEAGNWIVEPAKIRKYRNDKKDIKGELKLEKNRLEASTRQGFIYFMMTGN